MPTRAEILAAARKYLGVRWKVGGRDAVNGLDCVGLLAVVARDVGYVFTSDQFTQYSIKNPPKAQFDEYVIKGTVPGSLNAIKTGSILLLKQGLLPWHCGLAVMEPGEPAQMIHASIYDRAVVAKPLIDYSTTLTHVREYPGVI